MKRILFFTIMLLGSLIASSAFVHAANLTEITYPIKELGSCEDKDDCFVYCSDSQNFEACHDFGTNNGLVTESENTNRINTILESQKGPGECNSAVSCEVYCSDIQNIDECLSYAEKNEIISKKELNTAREIQSSILETQDYLITELIPSIEPGFNNGPGGCESTTECMAYCMDVANYNECQTFAKKITNNSNDTNEDTSEDIYEIITMVLDICHDFCLYRAPSQSCPGITALYENEGDIPPIEGEAAIKSLRTLVSSQSMYRDTTTEYDTDLGCLESDGLIDEVLTNSGKTGSRLNIINLDPEINHTLDVDLAPTNQTYEGTDDQPLPHLKTPGKNLDPLIKDND
jgi:hypothetical protein